ncbi:hypothetical protein M407DRAFT_26557 [Tulasnella calospora MUT 4182]|uniref:Uncharacterized protein n=1 Tax=Tulasnella calospora MUT 4182 TaxID=1051891 RepID=A0A0C3KRG1_9AGAM|nr:hypothetical protein M407DRAFT_26557 [Tulasnella calospora MUT 4182]
MSLQNDEDLDRAAMALKALLPHASRWRSLSLPYMMEEVNEQLGNASLPNLVELTLHPISEEDENYSNDMASPQEPGSPGGLGLRGMAVGFAGVVTRDVGEAGPASRW